MNDRNMATDISKWSIKRLTNLLQIFWHILAVEIIICILRLVMLIYEWIRKFVSVVARIIGFHWVLTIVLRI